ncbi:glycosyl hydrolase family 28-related protein [Coraliomargarita sp. SDUM461004]|uniref:Glycosyl hydrolase family 28-related protein n=1 Tax=Thalassobacterium sedimentorum TaxID=3041258 RepID=A0ABU1AE03_9BACT|nr:glycosyl hydrolase family 28-related protein [Coraliomargarita sp. SDUM461004]MDQ8192977.1 glycosyl hydrolase family 28-related protein [Coraliomargarita sp. SDUM461004]
MSQLPSLVLTYALFLSVGCSPAVDSAVNQTSFAPSQGSWYSELYDESWSALPDLSFETDAFIQDFSYAGYALGHQVPPVLVNVPILNVLDFGADPMGVRDSTEAIQAAINQAASLNRQAVVVYLPEGTYRILPKQPGASTLAIRKDGIVLRGAGIGRTFLFNDATVMRGQQIIRVTGTPDADWLREGNESVLITADLSGPTIEIPVEQTEPFEVGDAIILRVDPNQAWIEDHQEFGWLGYEQKLGSMLYYRKIVGIDRARNILTIDAPTRYTMKRSYSARVYPKPGMVKNVGLEGFSIGNREHPGRDGWENLDFAAPSGEYTQRLAESRDLPLDFAQEKKSAYDVHFSYVILMQNVENSWIRDVESFAHSQNELGTHFLSNGIRLKQSRAVSVLNCSMQKAQYGGGGGNGYMYRIDNSNDCFIANSLAAYSRHGFSISGMSSSGNVLYRCRDKETGRQTAGSGKTHGKGSDHHMWFSHSNLFDNCIAENSWFEARDRYYDRLSKPKHNSTSAHTVIWNTTGISNQFHPFVVWSMQARYGYVIGTQGAVVDVRTDGDYPAREEVSAPVDIVEGVGKGETLYPQSLYLHQLARRLAE